MKLPGLERKIRVMLDWTLDLFFKRDIALFQPHPTSLVDEMHLEKGDCVFHAGDPARSLYIVKVGSLELKDRAGATIRTLTPGQQLGKQTLAEKRPWAFDAIATEPTTLVTVSGQVSRRSAAPGRVSTRCSKRRPGKRRPARHWRNL